MPTYPPLDSSIKQPYFPDTLSNKDLTSGTIHNHVEGIMESISLENPWQPYIIKITTNDLEKASLPKEWNTFHLSRKKLDYLHLKDFLKSKCEPCQIL